MSSDSKPCEQHRYRATLRGVGDLLKRVTKPFGIGGHPGVASLPSLSLTVRIAECLPAAVELEKGKPRGWQGEVMLTRSASQREQHGASVEPHSCP
jgi:hypothetical protein